MLRRIKWNAEDESTNPTVKEKTEEPPAPVENEKEEPKPEVDEKPMEEEPEGESTKMEVEPTTGDNATNPKRENRCDLIWEGEVRFAAFNDFQMRPYQNSELPIRKFLTDRGCVHYWDLAKNFIPTTT